jgi:hypothetical protein
VTSLGQQGDVPPLQSRDIQGLQLHSFLQTFVGGVVHPPGHLPWVGHDRDIAQNLRLAGEAIVLSFPPKFALISESAGRKRTRIIDPDTARPTQSPATAVNEVRWKNVEVNFILQRDHTEVGTPWHLDGKILFDKCYQRHALAVSFVMMVGRNLYGLSGQI